jgi:hypothetical protein
VNDKWRHIFSCHSGLKVRNFFHEYQDRRHLSCVITFFYLPYVFSPQTEQPHRLTIPPSSIDRNCAIFCAWPSTRCYGCFSRVYGNSARLLPNPNVARATAGSEEIATPCSEAMKRSFSFLTTPLIRVIGYKDCAVLTPWPGGGTGRSPICPSRLNNSISEIR